MSSSFRTPSVKIGDPIKTDYFEIAKHCNFESEFIEAKGSVFGVSLDKNQLNHYFSPAKDSLSKQEKEKLEKSIEELPEL